MPLYEYEAKNIQGIVLKGKMEANDRSAVILNLREKNCYPTKISEYNEGKNIEISDLSKIKVKDIAIFSRQFATVLGAGIPILRGLEILKAQTENKKLRKIIGGVLDDVQRGKSLSEAMKKYRDFPVMFISMVEVGETSGTLDKVMDNMANYYDKEYNLNQKIKQALTYPIVVSVFAIIVVTVLVTKVIPIFVSMIKQLGGKTLPLPTRIVMGISSGISNNWLFIIILILAFSILLKMYFSKEGGIKLRDTLKLKMPILGKIYKQMITARFARTFGILITSGVPLVQSLNICSNVINNYVVKKFLDSIAEQVKKGVSLGDILGDTDMFPPMLVQMIKIGEESGTLDSILGKTAEFYDSEVENITTQLTTIIEPVIIIFLAVVVGLIILSIVMPIFDVYQYMA